MIENINREAIALIDERRRAEARAGAANIVIARSELADRPGAHQVSVDKVPVGYVRRSGAAAEWAAVYSPADEMFYLDTIHGRVMAAKRIAEHYFREQERQLSSEMLLAAQVALDLLPGGARLSSVLRTLRREMLRAIPTTPAKTRETAIHILNAWPGRN